VDYVLEARSIQGNQWRMIGKFPTEALARKDEKSFREWMAEESAKSGSIGWDDFRVVKVTETREVLNSPTHQAQE